MEPQEKAMEMAIGGNFEHVGNIEVALVKRFGLPEDGFLIDVGCGSGRLSKPLSRNHRGRYLGFDLVPDLVEHARKITNRPDWRFGVIDHIEIPEKDGIADFVCFFSVLTHLLHEQSYWYLEEARRVLKPGGKAVFSFIEFDQPFHWDTFKHTIADAKAGGSAPLNVFIDRRFLPTWADHLGMRIVSIHDAQEAIVEAGPLGQCVCVMEKV
jgi:SAM-dependent methyltransferase